MRCILYLLFSLIIVVIIFLLSNIEIQAINCVYIRTLWHNLKFISTVLYILIPLILIFIFLLLLFTNKWALRVEKLSIGGFSILFDNPIKLYKRQVKNFLDSKRTIFKIDFCYDNFKETFDSYFEIYHFFRDEIKILGNVREKHFGNKESENIYNLANQTLKVLNNFLTMHQSDYRRWYTYIEKNNQEKYYLMPIGELQKEYVNYKKLCCDFKKVNEFFINKVANEFEIDLEKWEVKNK